MPRKPIQTTLRQAYKKLIKPNQFLYLYNPKKNTWQFTDDHVVEQGYCRCNEEENHLTGKKLCRKNGTGKRTRLSRDDLIIASRFDHSDMIFIADFGLPAELHDDAIVCNGYKIVPVEIVECKGLLNRFKSTRRK